MVFEHVRMGSVGKNMGKEAAVFTKPFPNPLKEPAPVPHVFKHFNRNNSVKAMQRRPIRPDDSWIEIIHVAGDDFEVLKLPRIRDRHDVGSLRI